MPTVAPRGIVPPGAEGRAELNTYSPVMVIGPWVLCAGVIGRRADGTVPEEPEEQYRAAFETIAARLASAGASWGDVVDMTTFHVHFERLDHRDTFRRVRSEYVREPYPAWTSIGVAALFSAETLVEIKVTAYRKDGELT